MWSDQLLWNLKDKKRGELTKYWQGFSLSQVGATLVLNTPRPSILQGNMSPSIYGNKWWHGRVGAVGNAKDGKGIYNMNCKYYSLICFEFCFCLFLFYWDYLFYFFIFHSYLYWKDIIIMGKWCFSFFITRGFCMVSF